MRAKLALITKAIEPTHHAIVQMLGWADGLELTIFVRGFDHAGIPPGAQCRLVPKGIALDAATLRQFDLVHVIYDGALATGAGLAALAAGLPTVVSLHGGFDTQTKIFQPGHREQARQLLMQAGAVTVPCRLDLLRLEPLGIRRPIAVLGVPIDPALLPQPVPRNPARLIAVCRLVPKKGVDLALRALALLPGPFRLEIVGDGPLHGEIHDLAARLGLDGRVTWHGALPLESTLRRMAAAGILLHPARIAADGNAEGAVQAILWAMAMGLPVVTTATGSIPEIVRHRVTGWLAPAENPTALAQGVLAYHGDTDLKDSVAGAARAYCLENHSPERSRTIMEAIYERLLA